MKEIKLGDRYTKEELAQIIASETINITNLHFESATMDKFNRKFWAFFHLGFISGLKISGYPESEIDSLIERVQEIMVDEYQIEEV